MSDVVFEAMIKHYWWARENWYIVRVITPQNVVRELRYK